MRSGIGFRDVLLGSGLVVALTTMFVVAAVLAGAGLYLELNSTSVVVAQRPTTLVASQTAVVDGDHAAAADDGAVESAPSADPDGAHGDSSGSNQQPVSLQAAGAEQRQLDSASPSAADKPSALASPEAVASDAPSLEPPAQEGVKESPQPEPPAARVRPTPGPRGAPRSTADLPIVMYHHVGPLPPDPDIYRRDLTVSPDLFARTLDRLADQGVETVTMADLFEHFAGGPALPKRAVVLTFDDGYDDNYDHAFRLLKERGMVGTFFVTTDFVARPGYLTWDQVKEMADAGMKIAAHSSNHADFTKIGPNELKRQLAEPKAILEEHLGQPVRFLAYPAGKYNAGVMAASRAAGYEAAVTVLHGTRHVPGGAFELSRVRARGADTAPEIVTRMTPPSWRQ